MFSRNKDIRKMKGAIPYYVIAEELGISEVTLYNWLKKELTPEKRELITNAINQIKILGPKFHRGNVRNKDIRKMKGAIPYYVIAEELGVSETTLYNWLKKELTPEKRELITNAINQIKILGPKFHRGNNQKL